MTQQVLKRGTCRDSSSPRHRRPGAVMPLKDSLSQRSSPPSGATQPRWFNTAVANLVRLRQRWWKSCHAPPVRECMPRSGQIQVVGMKKLRVGLEAESVTPGPGLCRANTQKLAGLVLLHREASSGGLTTFCSRRLRLFRVAGVSPRASSLGFRCSEAESFPSSAAQIARAKGSAGQGVKGPRGQGSHCRIRHLGRASKCGGDLRVLSLRMPSTTLSPARSDPGSPSPRAVPSELLDKKVNEGTHLGRTVPAVRVRRPGWTPRRGRAPAATAPNGPPSGPAG